MIAKNDQITLIQLLVAWHRATPAARDEFMRVKDTEEDKLLCKRFNELTASSKVGNITIEDITERT